MPGMAAAPAIVIAGECGTRAAQEHGAAAARAMLGGTEPYARVPWFWTDQDDFTLQVAGLTGTATGEVVRVRPDGTEIWFGLADGGRLVTPRRPGRETRWPGISGSRRC